MSVKKYLISFSIILASIDALAYSFSEKSAFCEDYARSQVGSLSDSKRFDLQREYNKCLDNAEKLIDAHLKRREALNNESAKFVKDLQAREAKAKEEKAKADAELKKKIDNIGSYLR